MHTNPAYRKASEERARDVARQRGFGVLTVATADGILASHVPFLLDETTVAAHLARGNPIVRRLKDGLAESLLIVSGPDGYISPDWYGMPDQVPTWNYVAVHIRGSLRLLPDEALRPHLECLSAANEARLAPKRPWTMDKMTDGIAERMMRMIVPVEMTVASVESTFKFSQNKTDEARLAAADAVELGAGQELAELAEMMRRG